MEALKSHLLYPNTCKPSYVQNCIILFVGPLNSFWSDIIFFSKPPLHSSSTYVSAQLTKYQLFFCIIAIPSTKSMSKLINVNCLHFIGCQNYTNVLINCAL